MEHRYSARHLANAKILIYKSGLPMAIGCVRNISRHGLFVASEYNGLALNQWLEIELLGGHGDGNSHRRCRALVTHTNADGFGIAIDEDSAASCEWVERLLSKCRLRTDTVAALPDALAASLRTTSG